MDAKVWRFVAEDLRLGYGDGREIVEGETLAVEGEIVPMARGIHGSVMLLDALSTTVAGVRLTRATLSGTVVPHIDGSKLAASHCTHDRVLTTEQTDVFLRRFGVWCAGRAMRFIADTQDRHVARDTLRVTSRYARGKATREELDAAWSARDTAWAAAMAAWEARDAWEARCDERNKQEQYAIRLWGAMFERGTNRMNDDYAASTATARFAAFVAAGFLALSERRHDLQLSLASTDSGLSLSISSTGYTDAGTVGHVTKSSLVTRETIAGQCSARELAVEEIVKLLPWSADDTIEVGGRK